MPLCEKLRSEYIFKNELLVNFESQNNIDVDG